MTSRTPSYITKNRLGIYYFQYCLPNIFFKNDGESVKRIFRKSLHTRNRRDALKQSRVLWLIMDNLKLRYFSDPNSFGKAMELLMQFEKYKNSSWKEIEESFLCNLDETDDLLLDQALKYQLEHNKANQEKSEQIKFLQDLLKHSVKNPSSSPEQGLCTEENLMLSGLIDKWLEFKKPSLKISSYVSINQSIILFKDLISEICGHDPTTSDLTENRIREYKKLLEKLPAHRNAKKLAGKTLIELCELNLKPIAHKTIKGYLAAAADFIKWAEKDGYSINPKLIGILTQVRRAISKDRIKVYPLSDDDDLIAIFNAQEYSLGKAKRASDYWVPLIALYTGARLGEICQLSVTDIYQCEEVWVFDINDKLDNSLKTNESSKRIVPIHKELLKLKIIDYRDQIEMSAVALFPLEHRDKRGMFSAFTKRFGRRLTKLGIKEPLKTDERKSFHSFRHTVRTILAEVSPNNGVVIDSIVGHSSIERSVGEKIYTHTDRIKHKKELLDKLVYPIDFKKIKVWRDCIFGRSL